MEDFKNYFENKQFQANAEGKMLNADGWNDQSGSYLAEGSANAESSKPLIIKVVNSTTNPTANVVLLDANNTFITSGTFAGVTITSGIPNKTYANLLAETISKPFRAGKIMLVSVVAGQLDETMAVSYEGADGVTYSEVVTFEKDPMQFQTDRVVKNREFDVNSSTKLTISNILGSTPLSIYLYPKERRNLGAFGTRQVEQSFQAPAISQK